MQPGSFPTPGQLTSRGDCPKDWLTMASSDANATPYERIGTIPGETAKNELFDRDLVDAVQAPETKGIYQNPVADLDTTPLTPRPTWRTFS